MKCIDCGSFFVLEYGSRNLICELCGMSTNKRISLTEYSFKGDQVTSDVVSVDEVLIDTYAQNLIINKTLNCFLKENNNAILDGYITFSEKELLSLLEKVFMAGFKHK